MIMINTTTTTTTTTTVVQVATLVGNQSQRSKFRLDQSESRISPM